MGRPVVLLKISIFRCYEELNSQGVSLLFGGSRNVSMSFKKTVLSSVSHLTQNKKSLDRQKWQSYTPNP